MSDSSIHAAANGRNEEEKQLGALTEAEVVSSSRLLVPKAALAGLSP